MGQPGYPGQPPQQVDNNMTMSIVSIFLFWPLAIPAIINASKVNPLLAAGRHRRRAGRRGRVQEVVEAGPHRRPHLVRPRCILCCVILAAVGTFIRRRRRRPCNNGY